MILLFCTGTILATISFLLLTMLFLKTFIKNSLAIVRSKQILKIIQLSCVPYYFSFHKFCRRTMLTHVAGCLRMSVCNSLATIFFTLDQVFSKISSQLWGQNKFNESYGCRWCHIISHFINFAVEQCSLTSPFVWQWSKLFSHFLAPPKLMRREELLKIHS